MNFRTIMKDVPFGLEKPWTIEVSDYRSLGQLEESWTPIFRSTRWNWRTAWSAHWSSRRQATVRSCAGSRRPFRLKEEEMQMDTAEQDTSRIITLNKIAGARGDPVPVLRPLEPDELSNHVTIFVNELKLSDFKQVLVKHGIQAEFHGGVLYDQYAII